MPAAATALAASALAVSALAGRVVVAATLLGVVTTAEDPACPASTADGLAGDIRDTLLPAGDGCVAVGTA